MKKRLFFLCVVLLLGRVSRAQSVGFGSSPPQNSAQADINSTGKGLLIPRMGAAVISAIVNPAKGLMVYDSVSHQLKINVGTSASVNWQPLAFNNGWGLHGNGGTNPAVNFIGSTDDRPLRFGVNNVASGWVDSTSGNSFLGYRAGRLITGGYGNMGIGYRSLDSNTTGKFNVTAGDSSMLSDKQGYSNTLLGHQSMVVSNNGEGSTGAGFEVLYNTGTGLNTAFGALIFGFGANSVSNTVAGDRAMSNASGASSNTAIGSNALNSFTGFNGVAIGYDASNVSQKGNYNAVIGYNAFLNNSGNKDEIVAIGGNALSGNGSGARVVGTGSRILATGSADDVVVSGYGAGGEVGMESIAIGAEAMVANSVFADQNIALGRQALYNTTQGIENTALGALSGYYNTTGNNNTGLGFRTNYSNQVASGNTAAGVDALFAATLGANTAIGGLALSKTTASMYNTVIGYNSGSAYDMGYNNTLIGANCDISTPGLYNVIAIGQDVTCTASSQARIGNAATGSIGGYADWTSFSDGRYKKEVSETIGGLDFVMKLRPVTYHLDVASINSHLNRGLARQVNASMAKPLQEKATTRFTGFVAQEVEAVGSQSGYSFTGLEKPSNQNSVYGLRYDEFMAPLIKAIQEQQQQLQVLKKENAELIRMNEEEEVRYQEVLKKVVVLESSTPIVKK
jgi:hypothetical protein